MIIFKYASALARHIQQQKLQRAAVGFVPTMGALHKGHIALIEASKKETQCTVCSIFINPTQFNNAGDFQHYPKTIEKDIVLLEAAGTDILFLPSVNEMYPEGTANLEHYDLGFLETVLEGKYRPGHFQGVCQVMHRLLKMVSADKLFMGQKDYQQCMVVKRLLELTGIETELITFPTVREPDGLAMSSRNLRLPEDDRKKATNIYKALELIKAGESLTKARDLLTRQGFKIDYVELADRATLAPKDTRPAVALIAAFLGDVRLIDNMLV